MVSTTAQVNGQVFDAVSGLNIPVTMNTGPIVATVASAFGYNLNAIDENVTFDITIGGMPVSPWATTAWFKRPRRRSTMRFLISTSRTIR